MTSRFTGGLKWMPVFRCTVTVLLSEETSGFEAAMSGTASVYVFGLLTMSGRCVANTTA